MQTKTTMRYHLILVKMAIIKKSTSNNGEEGMEKRESSYPAGGNVNWCSHYGRPYGGGLVGKSCPTLCNPVNCSLPGFSIHGIFQAKVLKWVAISFSSGSSQPRDRTQVSHIVGRHFTIWATREVLPNHVLKVYRQNSVLLQTCNFLMWFKEY